MKSLIDKMKAMKQEDFVTAKIDITKYEIKTETNGKKVVEATSEMAKISEWKYFKIKMNIQMKE